MMSICLSPESVMGWGVRGRPWPPHAESWPPYWPPWPDPNHPCNHHIAAVTTFWRAEPFQHCDGTTGHFRCAHILSEPPSLPGGELPAGARCSGQGETGCWEFTVCDRADRHRLPSSAAPTVFLQRVSLRPSSEVAGETLPAAGGGDREASGEGQRVVGPLHA